MTPREKRATLRAEYLRLKDFHRRLLREFEALRTAQYSAEASAEFREKVIEYQQQLANHAIAREWTYWPPCGRRRTARSLSVRRASAVLASALPISKKR